MTDLPSAILRVTGVNRVDFLQGLVTNDVGKLAQGMVYAALLTPQGKWIADFFLVPDTEAILIDVAEPLADRLLARLSMYKLRANVTITRTDQSVTRGLSMPPPDGAHIDPRHPDLGWRAYDGQPGDGHDWTARRVALGVPQAITDLTPDSFILEMGFERLNGVDFRKGCYVGQEVTARMKHKTSLRKGLARVMVEGDAPSGTAILQGNRAAGTLLSRAGSMALAYLRFDRTTGGDLHAGGSGITLL